MLYIDGLVCSVNSPFFNAVGVSCQLLGESAKVNVTLNCTSCTNSFKPHAVITDGPVIIPNLPAGTYSGLTSSLHTPVLSINNNDILQAHVV